MRRVARVDANQKLITEELRQVGYSVALTHTLGRGFPDMVVGYGGINMMFEIKDPDQPPSKRKLTDDEVVWHDAWRGQIDIVTTAEEIIQLFNKAVSC